MLAVENEKSHPDRVMEDDSAAFMAIFASTLSSSTYRVDGVRSRISGGWR